MAYLPLDWGYQLILGGAAQRPAHMVLPGVATPKFPFTREYLKYTLWMGVEDYRTPIPSQRERMARDE